VSRRANEIAQLPDLHDAWSGIGGNCHALPVAFLLVIERPLSNSIGLEFDGVLMEEDADATSTEVSVEDLVGTMENFRTEDMLFRTSLTEYQRNRVPPVQILDMQLHRYSLFSLSADWDTSLKHFSAILSKKTARDMVDK
jgi:hypothetical protein